MMSDTQHQDLQIGRRTDHLLGPGRIIMVVGPSGAGKDTLLAGVKDRLADNDIYVFPRRMITREADPSSEDHETISAEDFTNLGRAGRVGLSWEAHGLGYIIPESIKTDILEGRTVVFNGSRGSIKAARNIYGHVDVVLVGVGIDILERRLQSRGRETTDQIERRLARATMTIDPDWTVVQNDGSIQQGVDQLLAAILSKFENEPTAVIQPS